MPADLSLGARQTSWPAPALVPPHAVYFGGEDHLRVTSFNGLASVALAIEGRFLAHDGTTEAFAERHVPNSDRTTASSSFPRGEGWLLNVQVRASSAAPRRGQCFVILEVVRGLTGAVIPLATLLQGYVTDTSRLAYPGSPLEAMTSGAGVLRSITGTDPAANVEITETVPTNARWRLLAVLATLVTGAAAGNREAELTIDDGTTVFFRAPSGLTQIISQTRAYCWSADVQRDTIAVATTVPVPLPALLLQGGWRINTVTAARDALDNWGAPQLLVEEWIED